MSAYKKGRIEELREKLGREDAVFLKSGANLCYLAGFCNSDAAVYAYITRENLFFLAYESYQDSLPEQGKKRFFDSRDALKKELKSVTRAETVLVEKDLGAKYVETVRAANSNPDIEIFEDVFNNFRAVKTAEEVKKVREAVEVAEKVFKDLQGIEAAGMTEKELAGLIESKMADYGGEKPSFDNVVAAGENGANPHHYPGKRRIKAGEPVVIDFGARKDSYVSDQTRTFVFGEAPEKVREVHETVLEAQKAAIETIEPGVSAADVDAAAREVIEDAGYGDEFVHSTGHGVGLEVHEPPSVSGNSDDVLEEGMLVTVEPGIYLEGKFGVRIEDIVKVTKDGCERLNTASRELEIK